MLSGPPPGYSPRPTQHHQHHQQQQYQYQDPYQDPFQDPERDQYQEHYQQQRQAQQQQQRQWPAPGENMAYAREESWWKPKYWRKRTWAIVVPVIIIVLIIVIVVPVKVTESNRYPNYTRLDYSLADTCEFDILPSPPWRLGTWHLKEIGVEVGYDEKPES